MRLKDIAEKLGAEVVGDDSIEIKDVAGLDTAGTGDLTYVKSEKLIEALRASGASAVITKTLLKDIDIPQLITENPQLAFAKALELFYSRPHEPKGIMEGAIVSPSASIGKDVSIYPNAFISDDVVIGDRTVIYPGVFIGKGSKIGEDTVIYPNVTIYDKVTIGSRVRIHSGTVIGSDGFGYIFNQGIHYKIPQVGGVIVENDVEIGAGVTIDRATTGNTVIGEGTKIDNLVQIAHNVRIGKHCIIIAQVGIAGSCEIGNYVTIAGQAGISDHVRIGDGCIVAGKAGIMSDIDKGAYSGAPAMPHFKWLRVRAAMEQLPDLLKRVREIEKTIKELKLGGEDDRN